MAVVLPCVYFGSFAYYYYLLREPCVVEAHEYFVKQTERSRCLIATSQGVQMLSLPTLRIRKTGEKTPMAQVQIANESSVKRQHWQAIITAYNRSPFFEYYQAELKAIFQKEHRFLIALNQEVMQWVVSILQPNYILQFTDKYQPSELYTLDFRLLPPTLPIPLAYTPTFATKTVCLANLSMLDALFHLSPTEIRQIIKGS